MVVTQITEELHLYEGRTADDGQISHRRSSELGIWDLLSQL